MDWYLDAQDPAAVSALRAEVADYLERHAEPLADVDACEVVVAEILSNAARHATGPAWVSVEWLEPAPTLVVRDLGPGFQPQSALPADLLATAGRGLFLVSHLTDRLDVAARQGKGAEVKVRLPVRRPTEPSHDPPRRDRHALPAPEEASPDGTFPREAFLRALVVQLAQAVDREHGPGAAEAAVAQVGADVGGRMEAAYRHAGGLVEKLTPEQMADLYVRLKDGIEGDFYVIEANEERIVLGNRACPFGPIVQRAPSLCRMTSSVFGGIAARNTGHATVQLEQRIAVGDPECRVVVWLADAEGPVRHAGHRYTGPADPS